MGTAYAKPLGCCLPVMGTVYGKAVRMLPARRLPQQYAAKQKMQVIRNIVKNMALKWK